MNQTPTREAQLVSMRSDVQRVSGICHFDGELPTERQYAALGGMPLKDFLKAAGAKDWDDALIKLGFTTGTVPEQEIPSRSAPKVVTHSNGNGRHSPVDSGEIRQKPESTGEPQSRAELRETVRAFVRGLRTTNPDIVCKQALSAAEARFPWFRCQLSNFHATYWLKAEPEALRPMAGGSGDHPQQMDRSVDLRPDAAPDQKQNEPDSPETVKPPETNFEGGNKFEGNSSLYMPAGDTRAFDPAPKKSIRFAGPNGTFDGTQNSDGDWHLHADISGLSFDLLNKISGALFEHFFEERADV